MTHHKVAEREEEVIKRKDATLHTYTSRHAPISTFQHVYVAQENPKQTKR
jgi:hypothetical protein